MTANEAITIVDAWLDSLPVGAARGKAERERELFVTALLAGDLVLDLKVSNNRAAELMAAVKSAHKAG